MILSQVNEETEKMVIKTKLLFVLTVLQNFIFFSNYFSGVYNGWQRTSKYKLFKTYFNDNPNV